MSIQPNQSSNQWAADLPPAPTDALYWRERLYAERRKLHHWPQRPNPELNDGVRQYWNALWTENNDNNSQSA